MSSLISIKDLTVKFGRQVVLKDINLEVLPGDYINIIGPNGAGKSTLIKTILGLVTPEGGEINKNIKNKIGYLPQRAFTVDRVFPATVKEVISTGLLAQKKHPRFINYNDKKRIQEILKELHIEDLKDRKVGSLSGGEQQRVYLARALISKPQILILDEPTSALDPNFRHQFHKLLEEINQKQNVTIIHITHDLTTLKQNNQKILLINQGMMFYGNYEQYLEKGFGNYDILH